MAYNVPNNHSWNVSKQRAVPKQWIQARPTFLRETFGNKMYANVNSNVTRFILTTSKGSKICSGSYGKCLYEYNIHGDTNDFKNAGIIWFLFNGQAYRMPGY